MSNMHLRDKRYVLSGRNGQTRPIKLYCAFFEKKKLTQVKFNDLRHEKESWLLDTFPHCSGRWVSGLAYTRYSRRRRCARPLRERRRGWGGAIMCALRKTEHKSLLFPSSRKREGTRERERTGKKKNQARKAKRPIFFSSHPLLLLFWADSSRLHLLLSSHHQCTVQSNQRKSGCGQELSHLSEHDCTACSVPV